MAPRIRVAVHSLAVWCSLVAMGSAFAAPAAAQQGVQFFPRTDQYPFSAAVQVGDVLYLSGQIGAADDQKSLVPGGLPAESRRIMDLIGQTLRQHGLTYADLFKCTVMLADMHEWRTFNEIYATYFKPGHYPVRSAMGVSALALGARVEMTCLAWAPRDPAQPPQ